MRFVETNLEGVQVVELEPSVDERGFFARTFCEREMADRGLVSRFLQHNISFNVKRGTLRGMHWQAAPHGEVKVVRCTRGRLFDVVADVRPESASLGRWASFELSAENRRALYVPEGFAHGFQTLEDDTEVAYLMSTVYVPDAARGCHPDDPGLGIVWPVREGRVASARDLALPTMAELGLTPKERA
jgi:dTDP-4-dehydrorhamnose 3,5-epimerase